MPFAKSSKRLVFPGLIFITAVIGTCLFASQVLDNRLTGIEKVNLSSEIRKDVQGTGSISIVKKSEVKIKIDFGTGEIKSGVVEAENAFEALKKYSGQSNIILETKEYDFGVMISKIGDKKGDSSHAWMYYVNNQAGNVGADRYIINKGDEITWKYEAVE